MLRFMKFKSIPLITWAGFLFLLPLCFLLCQVSILTLLCLCVVKETNEISDLTMNCHPRVRPRVFCVPFQLCDKLPPLELIVTLSGSVYSFSSPPWHQRASAMDSQTSLPPVRSLLRGTSSSQELTDDEWCLHLGSTAGIAEDLGRTFLIAF